MLDDGQPQPRAANLLGVALVHPVKALKHPALVLRRNPDARVRHSYLRAFRALSHCESHTAAGPVILDGVFAQVIDHFVQHPADALHLDRRAPDFY